MDDAALLARAMDLGVPSTLAHDLLQAKGPVELQAYLNEFAAKKEEEYRGDH